MESRLFLLGWVLSALLTSLSTAGAQVSTAWTARYGGSGTGYDAALAMKVDAAGNVYVAGESGETDGVGLDVVTIKYGPSGGQLWTARYGLPGFVDSARDVAVDNSGNVYVVGNVGTTNGSDALTLKYNPSGVEQWAKFFDGGSNDYPTAVTIDVSGNVHVISTQALLKYDSNGNLLWSKRVPFTPSALTVDNSGAAYISGATYAGNNRWTTHTIKHNPAGDQLWASTNSGASIYAQAIAVDSSGNVYIGSAAADADGADLLALKYNPAGTLLWQATYDSPGPFVDNLRDLTIDSAGNTYMLGTSTGAADHDIMTVKLNPNGLKLWVSRYNNNAANASDVPVGVRVDSTGNVYVGGYSVGNGSQYDYVAFKLDPNGNQQWVARHDNSGGSDFAYDFELGPSETLFLTGSSQFLETGTDVFTSKLQQSSVAGRPQIVTPPADQDVTLGDSSNIVLSVTAAGPGPLSYQWRLNGYDIPGAVFSFHEIINVQPHHAGEYSVRVSNAAGETVTPEARLTVHQPPFIYSQSTNQVIIEGRSVALSVDAAGDPVLRYRWRFNNVDLPAETNQTLRLLTVSTNAAGTYTAVVTNAYGNAVSIPIRLTVLPRGPVDRWTWRSPLPQGNEISDIVYGNGRYVGVGQEGTIIVSTNGLNWTIHSRDIGDIVSIVFAEGIFVAVSRTGIYTSTDGASWTFRPTPHRHDTPRPYDLLAVAYGAGRFVAVGTGLLSSDDGITWSDHSATFDNFYVSSVAYGSGRFIIPYGASAVVSSNGVDWVLSFVPSGTPVQIAHGNGLFIGHSYDRLFTSTNGLDWQIVLGPTNNFYFGGVDFANGQYLAMGNVLFTSPDGIAWTLQLYSPDYSLYVVAAAGDSGGTIVVGDDGVILRSSEGASWTQIGGGSPNNLRGIVYARNRFTTVGNDGVIWYSADGHDFIKTVGPNTNNLRAIAYGNDTYVIAGSRGALLSSTDGSAWQMHDVTTNDLYGLVFINGHFISVGNSGTILLSTNGRDWTIKSAGTLRRFQGITYGGGLYVATGQGATLARSYDAHNWTPVSYAAIDFGYLESVIYTNGLFIGVGSNGRIFTSGNGTNWVRRLTGDFQELETIIYAEGQFIAAGARGTILTSSNAVDWVVHHALTGNAFRQLVYARGALWGVGNNEMVLQSCQLRPYLTAGSISAAGTEVIVHAEPGQAIKLQRSTDLQNWGDLPDQIMSGDSLRFVDPGAGALRFYRVAP